MTVTRTVATTVLAFFLAGLVPEASFAASETSATAAARQSGDSTTSLREAGRKAVTELVKNGSTHASLAVPTSPRTSRRAQSTTGGGSKVLPIVLTLVGVAASVGVTYYAVKEMKKTSPTTTGGQ
jgi:hypothetical protein